MKTFSLFACGLLLAVGAAGQEPTPTSLLLHIEELGLNGGVGPLDYRSEVEIFRDGLVTFRTKDTGCFLHLARLQAPREAQDRLLLDLAATRVGFASGTCALDLSNPGGFIIWRYTWIGKGGRRSQFEITTRDLPGPLCDERQQALSAAVGAYFAAADAAPGASSVTLSLPEPSPCDLGEP